MSWKLALWSIRTPNSRRASATNCCFFSFTAHARLYTETRGRNVLGTTDVISMLCAVGKVSSGFESSVDQHGGDDADHDGGDRQQSAEAH